MRFQFYLLSVSLFVLAILTGCSSTADVVEEVPQQQASVEPQEPIQAEPEPEPVLDTVFYFDYDDASIRHNARIALEAHAERLKSGDQVIRIEGHADERGTDSYNKELGKRRAEAVKELLVSMGVHSSKIETASLGEERPVVLGSGESVWQKNRRVELK